MGEKQNKTRVMLVGGGTGGHFFPLMGVAEQLTQTSDQPLIYYAGPEKYDEESLSSLGIKFVKISAGKRRRYFSILNFFDVFKTLWGIKVAILKLFYIYPDVVFSKGSYTRVPVIIAAVLLRIPVIVHESDSVFGSANKLGSKFARHIFTAYDEATLDEKKNKKIQKLGIPVRAALLNPPAANTIESLGIDPNRPVILVLGGSQGSERVNEQIFASIDDLLRSYTVIHQTGINNYDLSVQTVEKLIPDSEIRKHYHAIPFLDEEKLNNAYHVASVVVSRAGSTAMYEIALHHKPAIIIPIPETISHDQRSNAYANARLGGVVVLEEGNLKEGLLMAEIERIVQNNDIYESMVAGTKLFANPNAAARISEIILDLANEHVS